MVNLPLISPRTNPFSSPSRRFEPGSSVFKSPALTTEPRYLPELTEHSSVRSSDYYRKIMVVVLMLMMIMVIRMMEMTMMMAVVINIIIAMVITMMR